MNLTARLLIPLRGALLGVFVGGLAEGVWASAAGAGPLARLTVGAGLWVGMFPFLFVALLVVAGVFSTGLVATLRQRISTHPEDLAAVGVLFGAVVASVGVGLPWVDQAVASRVKDLDLVPHAVAIVAVLWLLGCALLGFLGFALLPRLLRTLPAWSLLTVAVLGSLGPVVWSLWGPVGILGKDLPLRPAYLLAIALLTGLGSMLVARSPRNGVIGVSLVGALLFAAAAFTPSLYGAQPAIRIAFDDGHGLAPQMVGLIHRFTDGDGDGFSPYMGGGDCDDADDGINPMAVDLPGNGIDEDCRDGDRQRTRSLNQAQIKRGNLPDALIRQWNVLFLTIDSLRPDRLEIYGYERETGPNIAQLAAKGLVFERAYSTANNTRFAIPTMFSGRAVADLDAERLGLYTVLGEGNQFIFDRLRAAGWHTEAHLPEQLLRGMWYGLDRSFDVYRSHARAKLKKFSAKAIGQGTRKAIEGLAGKGRPWALWAHFIDPHEPYRVHKGHDFGHKERDRYDSEIAGVDAAIGRIMDTLAEVGATENTLIFITSDHGEEFGEHGRRFHGKQLFEESIRVPLVMVVPGAPPKRIDAPVSLVDLPETVAHLVGLEPGLDYGNISLADVYTNRPLSPDRSLFAESIRNPADIRRRQVALVRGNGKAIVKAGRDQDRLYDLVTDPAEKINLAANPPEALRQHVGELRAEMRRQEDVLLADLRNRQVTRKPPPRLGDPVQLAPGLELLGAKMVFRDFGVDRCLFLRTWLRANDARKNYTLRYEVVDVEGNVVRKWTQKPLLGLYPTGQWAVGEVVEEGRVIRIRKLTGRLKVRIKLQAKKKTVFGPHQIAEFDLDQ